MFSRSYPFTRRDFFNNIQVFSQNLLKRAMGVNISSLLEVFISIKIIQIIDAKPENIIAQLFEPNNLSFCCVVVVVLISLNRDFKQYKVRVNDIVDRGFRRNITNIEIFVELKLTQLLLRIQQRRANIHSLISYK